MRATIVQNIDNGITIAKKSSQHVQMKLSHLANSLARKILIRVFVLF
tara:strand:+ start:36 stop:176 length:141 start_codon:yes stop_codon:yes gene_type:complete